MGIFYGKLYNSHNRTFSRHCCLADSSKIYKVARMGPNFDDYLAMRNKTLHSGDEFRKWE